MTMRCTEKTGKMVNIMEVVDSDDLIIITNSGVLMRQRVGDIRTIGRVTQGVKLVKLDKGTSISSITRVISEETTPGKASEDIQEADGEAQVDVEKNEQ